MPHTVVQGCASNTPGKAEAFASKHTIPFASEGYDALLAREDIDAVYVASTHNFHHDHVLQALRAGKHVLCEKPLAVTRGEAEAMTACAHEHGLFLMEAMWTRFLPAVCQLRTWLQEGVIGQIQTIRADFAFSFPFDSESRVYNPDLAGGALLDVGIYPVAMASMVMRGEQPSEVRSLATKASTGVDAQSAYLFQYGSGALAILSSGVCSASENRLEICGSEGRLVMPRDFHKSGRVQWHQPNGSIRTAMGGYLSDKGFRYEIQAAQTSIRAGLSECAEMPLAESVAIADTLDRIRAEWT